MTFKAHLKSHLGAPLALAALVSLSLPAQAHIGYTGRDFGSFTGLENASSTIANQAISGNFGWADAADADFGDSHKDRIYRFHLDNEAFVTITAQANATATPASIGGLLPGFSVYSGLAHISPIPADYDSAPITKAYLNATFPDGSGGTTKEGAWNAVGDWKIGNDAGTTFADLTTFTLKGYAVDGTSSNFGTTPGIVGDGVADGYVSRTFKLGAGDYTLFVGGADYAAQLPSNPDLAKAYGVSVSLNVSAVPEAETWAMALIGLGCVGVIRQRSQSRQRARAA